MSKEWFIDWFNTSYYHTLYKGRNYDEAEEFIDKLIGYLSPGSDSRFLDIACGKGRHSFFINKKGFTVDGYDLSEESILKASELSSKNLNFYVHDMRQIFRTNYYDFAFNLFTSFGYFKSERDEINALKSMSNALNSEGKFVIDFLNKEHVIKNLVPKTVKEIDGVSFNITKEIIGKHVVKTIEFTDKGQDYFFQEKVKLLDQKDFYSLCNSAGLTIESIFGNYNLDPINKDSDRLILIGSKNG